MRILHCLNSPHIGGIERLVIELALEQSLIGMEVAIMLDTRKGQFYEYILRQEIKILDSGITGGFDLNWNTFKRLKKVFSTFDVVHLHSFSPIRSLAAQIADVKTVYTMHGLSKGVRKEKKFKSLVREAFKTYFINRVNCFVANSKYTLGKAENHYGLRKTNSSVVLNGINLSLYTDQRNNINSEFIIGLVSRFTPRKRIDRLLKSFRLFLDRGGEGKLVLCGHGVNYDELVELSEVLKLEKYISFEGYVTNVNEYYEKFSLIVHPSDNEGFGLIGVEAYVNGKAILIFNDSGGLKEVVAPLEPENIVDSEEELANQLLYWSENRVLLNDGAQKRIDYAKKEFAISRMANDYLKVYNS